MTRTKAARLRVGHQLDEHLNRSRTMGPRKFGDGRIQVRPTARVGPPEAAGPQKRFCAVPPGGSAAHGARPQRISGSVIITGFVRDYDGFRRNRRVHLHHVGHAHDAGDRREVADEIEIELVVERRVDRQGCRRPGRTFTTLQEPTKSCRPMRTNARDCRARSRRSRVCPVRHSRPVVE